MAKSSKGHKGHKGMSARQVSIEVNRARVSMRAERDEAIAAAARAEAEALDSFGPLAAYAVDMAQWGANLGSSMVELSATLQNARHELDALGEAARKVEGIADLDAPRMPEEPLVGNYAARTEMLLDGTRVLRDALKACEVERDNLGAQLADAKALIAKGVPEPALARRARAVKWGSNGPVPDSGPEVLAIGVAFVKWVRGTEMVS